MKLFASSEFETTRPRISLDGTWKFSYDSCGSGLSQDWFSPLHCFEEEIVVPGCAQSSPYKSAGENSRLLDVELPEHSDNIMLRYPCKNDAWLQKTVFVADEWKGRNIFLHVGGVKPAGEFWLNGKPLGSTRSSRNPVRCEVTPHVKFGRENVLTARVFWPEVALCGVWDIWHAWSGIYRRTWLEAVSSTHIADVALTTKVNPPCARFGIDLNHATGTPLRVECSIAGTEYCAATEISSTAEVEVEMPDAKLWSDREPNLHRARLRLLDDNCELDEVSFSFGVREIKTDKFQILLNGSPIFLRGGCDDQVFPESVCPPCDKEFFKARLKKAKRYGFNYTKSACEVFTREFLEAADEVGYIVCQEMPFAALGQAREIRNDPPPAYSAMWREELTNIIKNSRRHASACVVSCNSETALDVENPSAFQMFGREFPAMVRALHPDAILFDVTSAFHPDLQTRHGRRDTDLMDDWLPFSSAASPLHGLLPIPESVSVPFVMHEWNWITSLPNPGAVARYKSTPLLPVQVPEMLEAAQRNGLKDELTTMFEASRQLKHALRKAALESAYEHPKVAGYHHWLIHDVVYCPEGVFDEWWNEPPDLSADEFKTYNNDSILVLKDGGTRAFQFGKRVELGILIAHFGARAIASGSLRWRLQGGDGDNCKGELYVGEVARGERKIFELLDCKPLNGSAAKKILLQCELWDGPQKVCWNQWPLWFFPDLPALPDADKVYATQLLPPQFGVRSKSYDPLAPPREAHVFITHRLTDATGAPIENLLDWMEAGGKVLLLSQGALPEAENCLYRSVPFNLGRVGNMGTVISDHPALGKFPHEGWCDFHFIPMIEGAYPMRLDVFSQKIHPIIRSIGHHLTMPDKAYLLEARVGKGVLLACSLNLQPHCHVDAAAQHMLFLLANYLCENNCAPRNTLSRAQLLSAIREPRT